MRFVLSLLSLVIITISLAGCGSFLKKEYTYIPPQNSIDKKCTSHCTSGKKHCESICRLKNLSGSACHCIPSFNTCYSACGGEVLER